MLAQNQDKEFYQRELASFLPDRIFDAHAHLWRDKPYNDMFCFLGDTGDVGYHRYVAFMDDLHPGRSVYGLFLPVFPVEHPETIPEANQWIAQQVAEHDANRGLFFVQPTDDPEWVRQEVRRLGLHGLKCYHTFADVTPTWEAQIPDFLPEPLVKVAHEEGWLITLHMVRSRAVADEGNIHWIRHYCETYPNMKLILAHSARGFQPCHNLEGLPKLRGLENLYCDTSANCEPMAHQAVIRILGHDRLMYGSDLPISHLRGRSLGAGDAFLWIYEETPIWGGKHLKIDPILVGLEHLRSIKWACWSEKLTDQQVEDIFWNNAARLMDVTAG